MGIINLRESFAKELVDGYTEGYEGISTNLTEDSFEMTLKISDLFTQGRDDEVQFTVSLKSSFAERLTYIQDQVSVMPDWIKTIVAYVQAYFQTNMLYLKDFRIREIATDIVQELEMRGKPEEENKQRIIDLFNQLAEEKERFSEGIIF